MLDRHWILTANGKLSLILENSDHACRETLCLFNVPYLVCILFAFSVVYCLNMSLKNGHKCTTSAKAFIYNFLFNLATTEKYYPSYALPSILVVSFVIVI